MTAQAVTPLRTPIVCECGREIFDGQIVRARVLRVVPSVQAKCRCKRWVSVPLKLT